MDVIVATAQDGIRCHADTENYRSVSDCSRQCGERVAAIARVAAAPLPEGHAPAKVGMNAGEFNPPVLPGCPRRGVTLRP